MRFAARVLIPSLILCLLVGLSLPFFSSPVFAQTTPQSANNTSPFTPNLENNVPLNQHTLAQTTLNEMIFAIGCQIIGIDLSNPATPCLSVNPLTHQFGYDQLTSPNGKPQLGGLLGSLSNGIAMLYTPTVSTRDYTRYIASDFGIVKPALAAPKNGFEGLSPLLNLWKSARDASYFFLIIAFIFIGLGIMMRVRIDPRTVMTIQNQIPRVIIAIILITFSYPIAAAMTDAMWATTYMGINLITNSDSITIVNCGQKKPPTLGGLATTYVLSNPFSFVNNVFQTQCANSDAGGILDLSYNVGENLSSLTVKLVMSLLGIQGDPSCGVFSIADCFSAAIKNLLSLLWSLVVFIIIIITLFRIWFDLLKAYAIILIYVILAPIFISVNLLPKRPLGFGKWIRVFFANLALFPATVAMLLLAVVFVDAFSKKPQNFFLPPLIGDPNLQYFGGILGFAILLLTPQTLSLLREKLGVPPVKQVGAAMQTFNAGRQAVGAVARKPIAGLTKRNATTGVAEAPLSRWWDKTKESSAKRIAGQFKEGSMIGGMFGGYSQRMKNRSMRGYYGTDEEMRQAGLAIPQRPAKQPRQEPPPGQPPAGPGGPIPGQPPITPGQPSGHPGAPAGAGGTQQTDITIHVTGGGLNQTFRSTPGQTQTAHEFIVSNAGSVGRELSPTGRATLDAADWQGQNIKNPGVRDVVERFLNEDSHWKPATPQNPPVGGGNP